MQAGAWELAKRLRGRPVPDVLFASDYLDLPAFRGFAPAEWARVPCLLYLHENQLTYPQQECAREGERDTSYGFTNLMSCVAAQQVVFNSEFHREDFGAAATALLARLPRPNPTAEFQASLASSRVIPPGAPVKSIELGSGNQPGSPLRILFNHRWQFDKDPLTFLGAMARLAKSGAAFELVLLGERSSRPAPEMARAIAKLEARVVHQGFAPERADYLRWLASCDLAVSCAQHEFFGISTVEAMAAGVQPLLPHRLSYPELVGLDPEELVLYNDTDVLHQRLLRFAQDPAPLRDASRRHHWREVALGWSDDHSIQALDLCVDELSSRSQKRTP